VGIKILQILHCKALGVPVVTMGGAGGRRDAQKVRLCDLQHSSGDRLLRYVRKKLRAEHRFPRDLRRKFGVMAVYSDELQVFPWADGTCRATAEEGENLRMDCASGFGAVTHVTAAFAMIGAGEVLRGLSAAPDRTTLDIQATEKNAD
jgi:tRNA A37 threonylcarbamoyladenosine dehydratase